MNVEMYGPRCKLMKSESGNEFVLLLDSFDEATQTSVIVKITMPRDQLREWVDIFGSAVRL